MPEVRSADLIVDLSSFACGKTALGEPVGDAEVYSRLLAHQDLVECDVEGFEIGCEDGNLDYVFLFLDRFRGAFLHRGRPIELTPNTTVRDVEELFGEPYWKDDDGEEVLLFYEDGRVELQFEFPGRAKLGFLTMMLRPVLADPEQRKAYGVTKPWPPR